MLVGLGCFAVALLVASSRALLVPEADVTLGWGMFARYLAWAFSWGAAALVAFALAKWTLDSTRSMVERVLIHLAVGIVVIVTRYVAVSGLDLWVGVRAQMPTLTHFLVNLPWDLLYYVLLVGIGFAVELAQRRRRAQEEARVLHLSTVALEARVVEARLQGLRSRLHPPLLRATLERIGATIPTAPREAHLLIVRLGDLLRAAIATDRASTVADEIYLLERYAPLGEILVPGTLTIRTQHDLRSDERPLPRLALVMEAQSLIAELEDRPGDDVRDAALSIAVGEGEDSLRVLLEAGGTPVGSRLVPFGAASTSVSEEAPEHPAPSTAAPLGGATWGPPSPVVSRIPRWAFVLLFVGFWTALGLLASTPSLVATLPDGTRYPWGPFVRITLLDLFSWGGLALAAYGLTRVATQAGWGRVGHAILHLLGGSGLLLIRFVGANGAAAALGWIDQIRFELYPQLMPPNYILYFLMVGGGYAFAHYRALAKEAARLEHLRVRSAELWQNLALTQLDALKAQIHPHFLFNTLNAIASQVDVDPVGAAQMARDLQALLDATLTRNDRHEVALSEEIAVVRAYLEIERVRFGDRLGVEIDVSDEAMIASVPDLLLQPLVENAVKHGMNRLGGRQLIRVTARRRGEMLDIRIGNGGSGGATGGSAGLGVGIANLQTRLDLMYGRAAQLDLRQIPDGGAEVEILLPWRRNPAPESLPSTRPNP